MWEIIKVLAMATGFFCWTMAIYLLLWATICSVNERKMRRQMEERINRRIWE